MKKIKIKRIFVSYKERIKGNSKWNTSLNSKLKLSIKYLKYLIKLRKLNI